MLANLLRILIVVLLSTACFAADYNSAFTGAQIDNAIGQTKNIKDYGAKCDEVFLFDGVTYASPNTKFTSATATFVDSDIGKSITIKGGGASISAPDAPTVTPTCTAGGSITCETTYYYKVVAINPNSGITTTTGTSASTAVGTNTLSNTNYNTISWTPVAGAYAYQILRSANDSTWYLLQNTATGLKSVSGSSFIDNGGYTAITPGSSGTIYSDLTTTITARTDDNTITLADAAGHATTSMKFSYGTDDSTALSDALAALNTAGGGTLVIPRPTTPTGSCLINSQILIPNDGGTGDATAIAIQSPIRITGLNGGNNYTWGWKSQNTNKLPGGPSLDLRYAGTTWNTTTCPAKICTFGNGKLEIDHISLIDRGSDSSAFILTTNTVLNIHDNTFSGVDGNGAALNVAIILGGSDITTQCYNSIINTCYNSSFGGYGTRFSNNHIDSIKRMTVGGVVADGILVDKNIVSLNCSNPTGAINEWTGSSSQPNLSNIFLGNFYSVGGYAYVHKMVYTYRSNFIGEEFQDSGGSNIAGLSLDANSGGNVISGIYHADTFNLVAGGNSTKNIILDAPNGSDPLIDITGGSFTASSLVQTNGTRTGVGNTTLGFEAGKVLATGAYNTFLGYEAGYKTTSGINNFAIGAEALKENVSSSNNVAVGFYALGNTTAGENTCIGTVACSTSSMTKATGIGYNALNAVTGAENVAVGHNAGDLTTSGAENVFIGSGAGHANTDGSNNIYIGRTAGYTESASNNAVIYIGGIWQKAAIYGHGDTGHLGQKGYTVPSIAQTGAGSPTIATGSTDYFGTFTLASSASAGQLTFANAYANAPSCVVTSRTVAAMTAYTTSTTQIVVTGSAGIYDYVCHALNE